MSSAQQIYDRLIQAGMTEAGALGVMGNLSAESGLEACRLQGDFSAGRTKSKDYADKVDNGLLTIDRAAADGLGWGLAQWTFAPRKRSLILFCLGLSVSIASRDAQVDFLIRELQQDYLSLWRFLCETDELYTVVSRVCKEFERPAVNNIQARYDLAVQLGAQLCCDTPAADQEPDSEYWPPRMLCEGMFGADVEALQAILKARGYGLTDSLGIFGGSTADAVVKFQADSGLTADAIAGRKTWAALLKL